MINQDDDNTCIIGTYKDSSSYYLRLFPQWDLVPTKIQRDYLSSTDIRNSMYNRDTSEFKWEDNLPNSVVKYLHDDFSNDSEINAITSFPLLNVDINAIIKFGDWIGLSIIIFSCEFK